MIKITQLKLPINHTAIDLERKIRKKLKIADKEPITYQIEKRSLDARKKPDLFYVYSVHVSCASKEKIIKRLHDPNVSLYTGQTYQMPKSGDCELKHRPIIVGSGPAGLFCAYLLTEAGFAPIVIERGAPIEERTADVEEFWRTGLLKPNSNVQFGEGGAGTFSDGKLNTVVKDPSGRNSFVLEAFIRFGASEEIRYEAKPHIGTDVLARVIVAMRRYLEEKGCQFCFHTQMTDLLIENQTINGIRTKESVFPSEVVVLALGHSARDTFRTLSARQIPMECKNFAVGFRVEHPQDMIDQMMYGRLRGNDLPASPYKVTSNFPNGRGVYSFCMCPGGYVVNASSQKGALVVNGMSYSGRSGPNANSAIIVSVGPEDFGACDALAGMRFQERLEQKAYELGNGNIPQQLYKDYCTNHASTAYGQFSSATKGSCVLTNLRGLLSEDMESSFIAGMEHFGHIIPGFDRDDAILSGVEARTSSPIRLIRDESFESAIKGLYPCGEGAGYAGGIMSAAIDGMKVAEAIISKYHPGKN